VHMREASERGEKESHISGTQDTDASRFIRLCMSAMSASAHGTHIDQYKPPYPGAITAATSPNNPDLQGHCEEYLHRSCMYGAPIQIQCPTQNPKTYHKMVRCTTLSRVHSHKDDCYILLQMMVPWLVVTWQLFPKTKPSNAHRKCFTSKKRTKMEQNRTAWKRV